MVNLAGNDYLALADHPHLKEAATTAIEKYGAGSGASRLVTGHLPLHEQVEKRCARFKHAEAALLTPTGFMANLAVLTTLAGEGDLICMDKLNHASLIDAARASGAAVRVFGHRNYDKLDRLLARFAAHGGELQEDASRAPRAFIVTDSVFSMDGDVADLPVICDLADRRNAIVVVDEAHATGVLGETGSGLCERQGVSERVDVVISTASKALGGLGGIVTARQVVIDTLVNHARSFIYTTAAAPAQVAALDAALDIVRDEPARRQHVLNLAARLRAALAAAVLPTAKSGDDVATPIIPIIVGAPEAALALGAHLGEHGYHAPAIRPPTVPPGAARVRICLRADLDVEDVDNLARLVNDWMNAHRQ